jgi:hypothetical protein
MPVQFRRDLLFMKHLPKKITPFLVLVAELPIGVVLSVALTVIGFLVGANLGGNGYLVLPYAGLGGYESVGMIGAIIGSWLGALLGCGLIALRYGNPPATWRSLVYTAFAGCICFLFVFSLSVPQRPPEPEFMLAVKWFTLFFLPTLWVATGRRLVHFYARLFKNLT